MTFSNFKNQHNRCPICWTSSLTSRLEKEIFYYVINDLKIDAINNDRKQIRNPLTNRPLELDIWIPGLNKAIEVNGKYWHSTKERKLVDRIKKKECSSNNIQLLVITDEMWNTGKKDCLNIIENFIKGL